MRLLAAAIFAILMTAPTAFTQTADQTQATLNFGQATAQVALQQSQYETTYHTEQVPDTCYRDEIQGYRNECHTEYSRVCETRYQQECRNVNYPVCQRIPRQVCGDRQVCTTRNEQVCNPRGCTTVPRRECHTERSCSTQYDSVCHNETRRECSNVPRQFCQDVPRSVCQQIPNVVRVPYACTRTIQVPDGQRLTLRTTANVSINLLNFAETGAITDGIIATMAPNGNVTLTGSNPRGAYLFNVIAKNRTEQMVSETEKVINYTYSVRATSIANLNLFLNSEIVNAKLYTNRIEFAINTFGTGAASATIKGHLKLVQAKNSRTGYILINDDFGASAIVTQGTTQTMMLKPFGINPLATSKSCSVELSIGVDRNALKKDLVNPEVLPLVADKRLQVSFEALPTQ
ncbi:MAG: hypothetical protein JST80_06015 [Bdellovibrionales bacterium]|nr:hypothetical protein [Bdellovibrionales bacterium]